MSESWPMRPIGELFEIAAGKAMSAAARNGSDKTPFLRTSNVLWDEIDLTKVDEMAIDPQELHGKLLVPGDLLVCEGGEIGRAAVWNGEASIMSFQNHLHRLRPVSDAVEPQFYVYFLQSGFTQLGIFEGAGNKTTIPNLSRNRLAALKVPHPDLKEQREIVSVLASVRNALKIQADILILAQSLKRTAVRELLTRGLRCEAQKETEIGHMPETWLPTPIAQLGAVKGGKRMPKGVPLVTRDTGRPYIRVTDFKDHGVREEGVLFVPNGYEEVIRRYRISSRDIYISIAGTIRLVGQIPERLDDANLTENAAKLLLSREDISPRYVMHALASPACQDQIQRATAKNAQPKLALTRIEQLLVPFPASLEEQLEIAAVLDVIDRKIELHRRKRAVFEKLFKALLHKLMTGEIRVSDLDLSASTEHSPVETAA